MVSKYFIDEMDLKELHSQGHSNREIGKRIDVPHWKVARELKRHGLKTNALKERGNPPERVDDTHSKCNKCNAVTLNTDFPWVQGKADGRRLSYCKKCRKEQCRADLGKDPERYWKDKESRIRRNKRGYETVFSKGYLFSLWNEQKRKCFYTGVDLETQYGKGAIPQSPSVDRLDNNKGYIEGNLVICQHRINSMKKDATLEEMKEWMPKWYNMAITKLKTSFPEEYDI